MIPGFRKASLSETPDEQARNKETKRRLINELSNTVKELQKTHLDEDLDIDKNDEHALMLCTLLEAVLLNGYQDTGIKMSNFYNLLGKMSPAESVHHNSFWNLLVHFMHKDVKKELEHLSHITTPIGQCRAWVRLALNDCLIESYLDAILSDHNKLRMHYKPGAFMLEEEMPYIMISFLQGLIDFKFNLNYNTPSLNTWTGDTLAFAGIWQLAKLASHSHQHAANSQVTSQPSWRPSSSAAMVPTSKPLTRSISREESCEVEIAKSVQENDSNDLCSSNNLIRNQDGGIVRTIAENTENTLTDFIEEKCAQSPSSTDLTDSQEDQEQEEKVDDKARRSSQDKRMAAVSPVPMLGSNKLGVSTGWSSAFDTGSSMYLPSPEERTQESQSHSQKQTPTKDHSHNQSSPDPETYTRLFSNYMVQGAASFQTSMYDQEDSSRKMPIPKVKSPDNEPQMRGFEVVPQSSSVHSEHADEKTLNLMSNLTRITNEQGLDHQNYQCNGCGRNIGMIYGEAKVCKYDSFYYCYECHIDDEHVIPARIIYNWDLRKHSVCRSSKLFLLQIEEEPLLNIDETNPSLYAVIDELHEIRMLRRQLQHLKGFLFTCKEPIADEVRRRIWPREYLWDDIHQYSLLDLIQTSTGQLAHHIKKIISYCKKHVYKCQLCCQKGFICEFCNDPKIIYPFQINTTTQCPKCKAVFHKACIVDRNCPKCARRQKLQAAKSMESNFKSPWE